MNEEAPPGWSDGAATSLFVDEPSDLGLINIRLVHDSEASPDRLGNSRGQDVWPNSRSIPIVRALLHSESDEIASRKTFRRPCRDNLQQILVVLLD